MQKKYAYGSLTFLLVALFLMLEVATLNSGKVYANIITIKSDFSSGLGSWVGVDSDPFPTAGFTSAYDASTGFPSTLSINNYLNFYKGTVGSLRFAATGADVRGARYYTQTVTLDQPRPSARLSFAYKKKWAGTKTPLAQNLFVAIKQPSGKVAIVWQERGLSQADAWKKVENLDVGAYFFETGNYEIRIGGYLDNGAGGTGMLTEAWFDEVYFDLRQNNTTRPTFAGGSVLTGTPFSKGQIDLSWPQATDPEGIDEYRIFINGHKRPAAILPVTSLSGPPYNYSVTKDEDGNNLQPSTLYQFSVRAVDKDGNYSDPLIDSESTTADDGTPATLAAPTYNPRANNVIINGGFEKNSKSWTLRNDTSSRRTAGFTTAWDPMGYIGTTANYTYLNGEAAGNLIPLNVSKGGSFSAYAKGGRSNRGGRYIGQTFNITNTTGPFYLSFKYMKSYGGSAPANMELRVYITRPNGSIVEVTPITGLVWNNIPSPSQTAYQNVINQNINAYIPGGTTPATGTYKLEFRMYLRNNTNTQWSQISIDEVSVYVPDTTPPSTPAVLTGNAITDTQVNLSWTPSTDNVQVAQYNVYRSASPAGPFTTPLAVVSTLGQVTYSDTTVTQNNTYYYRVEAVDPRGNKSSQSSNLQIITPARDTVPPVKVPNVKVIGSTASEADVFWDLTTDVGFGVTKYQIYRADDNSGSPGPYTMVGEVDNNTTVYRDKGLTAKRTYWYYVVAVDRTLNVSPNSDQVSVYIQPSPHGYYDGRNAQNEYNEWRCANCHRGHKGQDSRLLVKPTQPKLCLTCHDSYGSKYVLKPDLQDIGGSNVFHPMKDTEAQLGGKTKGIIKCTSCHNPHGDKISGTNNLYPRWLRSKDEAGNYVYQGNGFCLNCHGQNRRTDLLAPGDDANNNYWTRTSGNHDSTTQGNDPNGKPYIVSGNPVMHFDISKAKLIPSSGTQITCVQCHDEHSSPNYRLTMAKEEGLCLKCHNDTATSASGTSNILQQFNRGGSRHNIFDVDQLDNGEGTTKVECISCHGPHAVSNKLATDADPNSTVVSDPFNTKRQWNGNLVSFCQNCHGDQTKLPQEKNDNATAVPYTVKMPTKAITTNVSGWDKRSFNGTDPSGQTSGHWDAGVRSCRQCHEQHGSDYPRLTKYKEDDMGNPIGDANGEGICFQCHKKTGYPSFLTVTPPDIESAFLGPSTPDMNRSGHPTLIDGGKHSDTESYKDMPLDQRHAECYDCHDMHSSNGNARPAANKATGTHESVTDQDVPPKAPGALRNIQGLGFNIGTYGFRGIRSTNTATFANWMQTSLTSSDAKYIWKPGGITYMFELCYKCHSSYSFGVPALDTDTLSPTYNTWQDSGPDEMTDVAREFNPENPSFHPVEAFGRTPNGSYTGTDSFGDAWGPNRMMYCTDCHGPEDATPALPRGPHGSVNPRILKGTWSGSTGASTAGALCFRCHAQTIYSTSGSPGTLNGFEIDADPGTYTANTATPYKGYNTGYRNTSSSPNNLHRWHMGGGGKVTTQCQSCHSAVPHGFYRRHLIVYRTDPSPYNQGTAKLTNYSPKNTGGYSKGDCSNNCGHG